MRLNTGLFNSGNFNSGNFNSGSRNSGDNNSGLYNSGDYNSGNFNSGDYNSGDNNSGDFNRGSRNSGDNNSGDNNSGDNNSGLFNACNYSTGVFNTKERNIKIFNVDSGMTVYEFKNSKYYGALTNGHFTLTKWVDYTNEEKKNSIVRQAIGGYLEKYTYKEACQNWWKTLSDLDKQTIQEIPNFNKDIFFEITGIEL